MGGFLERYSPCYRNKIKTHTIPGRGKEREGGGGGREEGEGGRRGREGGGGREGEGCGVLYDES